MRFLFVVLALSACQMTPEQSANLTRVGQNLSAIDSQGAGGVTCNTFGTVTTCQ